MPVEGQATSAPLQMPSLESRFGGSGPHHAKRRRQPLKMEWNPLGWRLDAQQWGHTNHPEGTLLVPWGGKQFASLSITAPIFSAA